jgi:hypothetical protein
VTPSEPQPEAPSGRTGFQQIEQDLVAVSLDSGASLRQGSFQSEGRFREVHLSATLLQRLAERDPTANLAALRPLADLAAKSFLSSLPAHVDPGKHWDLISDTLAENLRSRRRIKLHCRYAAKCCSYYPPEDVEGALLLAKRAAQSQVSIDTMLHAIDLTTSKGISLPRMLQEKALSDAPLQIAIEHINGFAKHMDEFPETTHAEALLHAVNGWPPKRSLFLVGKLQAAERHFPPGLIDEVREAAVGLTTKPPRRGWSNRGKNAKGEKGPAPLETAVRCDDPLKIEFLDWAVRKAGIGAQSHGWETLEKAVRKRDIKDAEQEASVVPALFAGAKRCFEHGSGPLQFLRWANGLSDNRAAELESHVTRAEALGVPPHCLPIGFTGNEEALLRIHRRFPAAALDLDLVSSLQKMFRETKMLNERAELLERLCPTTTTDPQVVASFIQRVANISEYSLPRYLENLRNAETFGVHPWVLRMKSFEQAEISKPQLESLSALMEIMQAASAEVIANRLFFNRTDHVIVQYLERHPTALAIPPRNASSDMIEEFAKGLEQRAQEYELAIRAKSVEALLADYLHGDSIATRHTGAKLMWKVRNDTVPYRLLNEDGQNPAAARCFSEAIQVMTRAFDWYFGFSALAFDTRRVPGANTPPALERFALDAGGETVALPGALDRFPGPGFILRGVDPSRVFARDYVGEFNLNEEPFGPYRRAMPWAAAEFDLLQKTQFIFLRGAVMVVPPNKDEKFMIAGEEYMYCVFNHHLENRPEHRAFMLPRGKIEALLSGMGQLDLSAVWNNPEVLVRSAGRLPLNLGWGSNLGGLCNAFPPRSRPYHEWEAKIGEFHTADIYGHIHKSHISGRYAPTMTPEVDRLLEPLRRAHDEVYAAATSAQNLLDLFRVAMSLWHKGYFGGADAPQMGNSEDQELVFGGSLPLGRTMLKEAYLWHWYAGPDGLFAPDKCPILCNSPILDYWTKPAPKFRLDTFSMNLFVGNDTIQLPRDGTGGGPREIEIWEKIISPLVAVQDDIRFYDRKVFAEAGT